MEMTKKERLAEMEAVRKIFVEEQQLFCDLGWSSFSHRETHERFDTHLKKYYAEDLIGVHAHHRVWPVTGRGLAQKHPLKGVANLTSYYSTMIHRLERMAHHYATLVWLNVKEDSSTKERFAVGCLVVEGLRQLRENARWSEDGYDPYYCHMGMWVLHQPGPGGDWKIRFIFSGLPVEMLHVPGGKRYQRRIPDDRKIGSKKKTRKYFSQLHQLFEADHNKEYQEAWYEAIPAGEEVHKIDMDWSSAKKRSGDDAPFFWDLLGWDVVTNGIGK